MAPLASNFVPKRNWSALRAAQTSGPEESDASILTLDLNKYLPHFLCNVVIKASQVQGYSTMILI